MFDAKSKTILTLLLLLIKFFSKLEINVNQRPLRHLQKHYKTIYLKCLQQTTNLRERGKSHSVEKFLNNFIIVKVSGLGSIWGKESKNYRICRKGEQFQ